MKLWIYDLRTNLHFTLKESTLKRTDLDDFVNCYFGSSGAELALSAPKESAPKSSKERLGTRPLKAVKSETASPTPRDQGSPGTDRRYSGNRHDRKESERFKSFTYEELIKRDKINLDIFWLKDEALEDSANLPAPEIIAADIVEDFQAAPAQFAEIANDLKG